MGKRKTSTNVLGKSCCNLAPTCHPQTQNAGYLDARPRLSPRCAAVPSASKRLAVSIICRRKNFAAGTRGLKSTESPVYGAPDCKSTVMLPRSDMRSRATEEYALREPRYRDQVAVIFPNFWRMLCACF